jgi:purine-cytosine permease-like protein
MRLSDFVALYGLVLIPMGGVIFADYYLLKKWMLIIKLQKLKIKKYDQKTNLSNVVLHGSGCFAISM